jgi:imidazole glycerol phosphate synthase subunit HisF
LACICSAAAFMLNLAKEWASFPVPYTVKGGSRTVSRGQSFYAGGLNKSLVTAKAVEKALVMARAQQGLADSIIVATAPEPPLDTREVPDDVILAGLWATILNVVSTYLKTQSA